VKYTQAQPSRWRSEAEVIIYAISTDDSGLILRGDKNLEKIAEATGWSRFLPVQDERTSRTLSPQSKTSYAASTWFRIIPPI